MQREHGAAGAGRRRAQAWSPGSGHAPPAWWRLVTAWQWLLTVLAAVGVGLSVVIAVVRATGHHQGWISEVSLIPWLLIMAAAMLVLGYVTAVSCRNLAAAAADREREAAEQAMRDRVAEVTHDLVLRRDRPGDRPVRAVPQGAARWPRRARPVRGLRPPAPPQRSLKPERAQVSPAPVRISR